jgi:hypothetical protein
MDYVDWLCSGMRNDYFKSSWPFFGFFYVKLDGVASSQPIGIGSVAEVIHVYEDIGVSVIASDEAISFLMVEPLDVSCYSITHFYSSQMRLYVLI